MKTKKERKKGERKKEKKERRKEKKKKRRTVKLKLRISAGARRSTISRMISWGNTEPTNPVDISAFIKVGSISISVSSHLPLNGIV